MDSLESHDVTCLPTPGPWLAQQTDYAEWTIVTDDAHPLATIAQVPHETEDEARANALLMAASWQMLLVLKAVDSAAIVEALHLAHERGYDISWPQVELMFGVGDLHAAVRLAIAAAEGRC